MKGDVTERLQMRVDEGTTIYNGPGNRGTRFAHFNIASVDSGFSG